MHRGTSVSRLALPIRKGKFEWLPYKHPRSWERQYVGLRPSRSFHYTEAQSHLARCLRFFFHILLIFLRSTFDFIGIRVVAATPFRREIY